MKHGIYHVMSEIRRRERIREFDDSGAKEDRLSIIGIAQGKLTRTIRESSSTGCGLLLGGDNMLKLTTRQMTRNVRTPNKLF